uniref:(northern house mosquito) hypothetical protein n=1 Tax=Culex pipiens TaxID=7175 RepID=A0A8D8IHK3_CULPI
MHTEAKERRRTIRERGTAAGGPYGRVPGAAGRGKVRRLLREAGVQHGFRHSCTATVTFRRGRIGRGGAMFWRAPATSTAITGRGRRPVQSDRQRGHESELLRRPQPDVREADAARDGENDRGVAVRCSTR